MSTEIWTFKYEPQTLEEMILSDEMRKTLHKVIEEKPNILLSGRAGVGKGTFMNIYMREAGFIDSGDWIKINASAETSVDNIRNTVRQFATTLGVGELKLVYMNEADSLSQAAQRALRDLIEQVQSITRFAFLLNYNNMFIDELKSRCREIKFQGMPASDIFIFLQKILKAEGIPCESPEERAYIVKLIKTFYPDMRKIIVALHGSVYEGRLDTSMVHSADKTLNEIFKAILEKDFDTIRTQLRANPVDYVELYNHCYNNLDSFGNKAGALLLIGEFLYKHSNIAIPEVNFLTMVAEMVMKGVIK